MAFFFFPLLFFAAGSKKTHTQRWRFRVSLSFLQYIANKIRRQPSGTVLALERFLCPPPSPSCWQFCLYSDLPSCSPMCFMVGLSTCGHSACALTAARHGCQFCKCVWVFLPPALSSELADSLQTDFFTVPLCATSDFGSGGYDRGWSPVRVLLDGFALLNFNYFRFATGKEFCFLVCAFQRSGFLTPICKGFKYDFRLSSPLGKEHFIFWFLYSFRQALLHVTNWEHL